MEAEIVADITLNDLEVKRAVAEYINRNFKLPFRIYPNDVRMASERSIDTGDDVFTANVKGICMSV
jgi:hypothetical protein